MAQHPSWRRIDGPVSVPTMPELPEVETVRRMLEASVIGRTIERVRLSGLRLRGVPHAPGLAAALRARTITTLRRHGKYLLIDLSGGHTIVSHLGMSGRWLFFPGPGSKRLDHVHVRLEFADGSQLWFQDPRRFGMFRLVPSDKLHEDPSLALLGPDPIADPPTGRGLAARARGLSVRAKLFLLDQRRIAGIGNIYASEILHRARVHPARPAGSIRPAEWTRIARETRAVLAEAIERMGTTFSTYRTLSNEPGSYGDQLRVYDRAGEPCRRCAAPVRRIVQGQRSTFYCAACQPLRATRRRRD